MTQAELNLHAWEWELYDEALNHGAGPISCGRMIGPYACCSVVCGDCLELMKGLPDGVVDAVITDPPYGINYIHGGNDSDSYPTRFAGIRVVGDDKPFDPVPFLEIANTIILWGANHYADKLPHSRGWLIWDKRCATVINDHSDCELAWFNRGLSARIFYQVWDGFRRGSETRISRFHPTQKPVCLMEWCIEKAGNPETILDPFCGSGTTLVAAKKLGRHFLGFEICHEYCTIARKRLMEVEAQPSLFEQLPEQLELTT